MDDDEGIVVKLDAPAHSVEHDFGDPFNSTWEDIKKAEGLSPCLLYTSPSPRD